MSPTRGLGSRMRCCSGPSGSECARGWVECRSFPRCSSKGKISTSRSPKTTRAWVEPISPRTGTNRRRDPDAPAGSSACWTHSTRGGVCPSARTTCQTSSEAAAPPGSPHAPTRNSPPNVNAALLTRKRLPDDGRGMASRAATLTSPSSTSRTVPELMPAGTPASPPVPSPRGSRGSCQSRHCAPKVRKQWPAPSGHQATPVGASAKRRVIGGARRAAAPPGSGAS
mmetsp:Transcript_23730/g.74783  ORF Transcript_23730/g.74783 Transcript_23730/m.74783 type:complete len:226 (+) Transcript_23730:438-1115(+)